MAFHTNDGRRRRFNEETWGNCGVTMMELIVALAVLATGTSIFISLYSQSLTFASTAHHRTVATQVAEARLNEITADPDAFLWGYPPERPEGVLFEIRATADDPKADDPNLGVSVPPPALQPRQPRAAERTAKLYDELTWKAFGRFPATEDGADAPYVEVIVRVRIENAGREAFLALTSSIPYSRLPKATVLKQAGDPVTEGE